ncbi:MAG: YybH family protein [Myxococcota bacterium]
MTSNPPRSPEELMSRFGQCVAELALDALVDLYEPGAVFVPKPGVVHSGRPAIRAALAELLALRPVMETKVLEVHEADDTALVIVDWSLRGTAPDATIVTQSGRSADVLRRQSDGTWRVLVDHP